MLDSMTIEELSVSRVKDTILACPLLSPHISEKDKEPSWDGNIYIYNTPKGKEKRKDGIRRLPVQVKGHVCRDLSRNEIKYSMEMADLQNYKEDGGIILFVVYIDDTKDIFSNNDYYRIYYQELLPVKLFHILGTAKQGQKTKTIELKALPLDRNRITSIITHCYENRVMQHSFAKHVLPSIEDFAQQGIIERIETPVFSIPADQSKVSAWLEADTYLYVKLKGDPTLRPVSDLMINKTYSEEISVPITVAGRQYYSSFTRTYSQSGITISLGHSVQLFFPQRAEKFTISFKPSKMLRERAIDLPFLIACHEHNGFEIDGGFISLEAVKLSWGPDEISQLKRDAIIYSKYVAMLDSQCCSEDIDFSTLSAKNIHDMALLTTAFVDRKSVTGFKPHLPMIFAMDIGTLKFALYVKEDESQSGAYQVYNALDYDRSLVVSPGNPDIERYEVPAAVLFKDSDFVCVSNIKFYSILPSFKAYAANEYIYGVANDVMLRMISAYDQTSGLRKKQLYETALSFADWLCTMPPDVWDKRIAVLNRFQILKRSPGLNAKHRAELYTIIDESNDRNDIKVAAYLLLDQHEQAAFYFAKMSATEQCDFIQYPIFYFWKQNVVSS